MRTTTNYLLTGATGLLGRNLLFEILKYHIQELPRVRIIILGRNQGNIDLRTRVFNIIQRDGFDYVGAQGVDLLRLKEMLPLIISCINVELEDEVSDWPESAERALTLDVIDYFFHIASCTDFRDSESIRKKLWSMNVDGTRRAIELAKKLEVRSFIYVGSAYSCGQTSGIISPHYVNFDQQFRNPYELSKLEAEYAVREFSAKNPSVKTKIFRPSTICGRLIEDKIGSMSKFDVFYAWMFFFLRCKERMFNTSDLQESAWMKCRVLFDVDSGLNIVPVDYAAKAMHSLTISDTQETSFHLVANQETPHALYISAMAQAISAQGIVHVDQQPSGDLNELERLYYKTVGAIFTPYITSAPMLFTPPEELADSSSPEINHETFGALLDYALENRDQSLPLTPDSGREVPAASTMVHSNRVASILDLRIGTPG